MLPGAARLMAGTRMLPDAGRPTRGISWLVDCSVRTMARHPERLVVFHLARDLCVSAYALAATLAADERFGVSAQMKRAAVSVVCNIAEGSSRRRASDYARFIEIAAGSALEVRTLADLASLLGLSGTDETAACRNCADHVFRALLKLQRSTEAFDRE
jgi:four helix bundle protein